MVLFFSREDTDMSCGMNERRELKISFIVVFVFIRSSASVSERRRQIELLLANTIDTKTRFACSRIDELT